MKKRQRSRRPARLESLLRQRNRLQRALRHLDGLIETMEPERFRSPYLQLMASWGASLAIGQDE